MQSVLLVIFYSFRCRPRSNYNNTIYRQQSNLTRSSHNTTPARRKKQSVGSTYDLYFTIILEPVTCYLLCLKPAPMHIYIFKLLHCLS